MRSCTKHLCPLQCMCFQRETQTSRSWVNLLFGMKGKLHVESENPEEEWWVSNGFYKKYDIRVAGKSIV